MYAVFVFHANAEFDSAHLLHEKYVPINSRNSNMALYICVLTFVHFCLE